MCSQICSAEGEADGLPYDVLRLQAWLEALAKIAQIECDGMTHVISRLLHKNGIEHVMAGGELVDQGRLKDPSVGSEADCGVTHWWLELGFSYIIDFRARMWMGPHAQHGVLIPDEEGRFFYRPHHRGHFQPLSGPTLDLTAETDVSGWPPFE